MGSLLRNYANQIAIAASAFAGGLITNYPVGKAGSSAPIPTGTGFRHVTNGVEDPTAKAAPFVSPNTREIHVGDIADCLPTMEAALAAVALLDPAPSASNPVSIVVHSGSYSPASEAWAIPAYVAINGAEGSWVAFSSDTYDLFSVQGDGVNFNNFHILASTNAARTAFLFNGHSFVNIDKVGMWGGAGKLQRFIYQTGSTWHQHSISNCFYDSGIVTGNVVEFNNTGSNRFVDVEIEALFGDSWSAGASGFGFYLNNVQDVRFKNCKIRTASASTCVRLVGAGSWVELDTVTSVIFTGSYGKLFNGDAGTSARIAYCDGQTAGSATITTVGGLTGPDGPQGPPGPVGNVGPGGPAVGLTTALDLDLAAQTQASFTTDGTKTIAGINAFRLSNSNHGQNIALNNGAGLYTRCSTFNSVNYGTTYNGPRWTVGLKDLTGVDLRDAIEQWVMFMFSQPHTPNANYEYAYLGLSVLPGADSDTNHSQPVVELGRGFSTSLGTLVEWQSGATVNQNPAGCSVPATTDDVYAFRILNNKRIETYCGQSSDGAWPSINNLKFVAAADYWSATQGFSTTQNAHATSLQWAAVLSTAQSNTVGASDLLLKKLKVLYR